MITYVAGLVFVVSLGFALAAPSQIKAIDDWAFQECNASDPVPRSNSYKIADSEYLILE